MQINTLEMRALATTATQGKWMTRASSNGPKILCRPQCPQEMVAIVDADYIAAVNPATILSLLDRLEASEAREIELVDTLKHIRGASSCCDAWDQIDEVVPYDAALYS